MKFLKIMLTILVTGIFAASFLSCNSESDESEQQEYQLATVQRGDITIDITAAGNLALSHTEELAIDLFYGQSGTTGAKGTIGEVLVEEGDTVEEGQVLVTIDKDEWDDELSALEDQVTAKERDLLQAEINLETAEQNLKNAQDGEATKDLAVLNAQISLDTARRALNTGIAAIDYDQVEANLRKAEAWYDYVLRLYPGALYKGKKDEVLQVEAITQMLWIEVAKEALEVAQAEYDKVLAGYDSNEVAIKKKQVEAAEISLEQAQGELDEVVKDVTIKELSVTLSEGKQVDAQKALEDAQEKLVEAQSKSPELKAPFDGFITSIYVEGGDEVLNGTVAVEIADPNKFEADILVSEMDILQVNLDMEAYIQIDAMSGMSLPARVTHISPTATIQSGVVNYEVKVEVQSMEAVAQEMQEARQQVMADIAAGELPPPLQQAIEEGRITREQAEEMIKQGPPEGMELPEGFTPPAGTGEAATGQLPTRIPENFQLREGLTVTVTIIVEEKADVLLVPNAAITTEGTQSYVQMAMPSGESEKRAIQTGLSDYQFTEVTEGLSEGEEILVPQGTTTTTTTEQGPPRGMFFGGPPR